MQRAQSRQLPSTREREREHERDAAPARPPARRSLTVAALCLLALSGCATVAPEQRAVLADPTMQLDVDAKHEAGLRHAIENREGSMGGTGVQGGGCGCN